MSACSRSCLRPLFGVDLTADEHAKEDGRVTRLLGHSQRAVVAFAVGLLLNLVPGAWYLVALKDIAQSSYDKTEVVVVVVAFCVVMYALIEIPLLGFVFAPERAADLSRRFNVWLGDNSRTLVDRDPRRRGLLPDRARHRLGRLGRLRDRRGRRARIGPPAGR